MVLGLFSGLHYIPRESDKLIFVADGLRTTVFNDLTTVLVADIKYKSSPVKQAYLIIPLTLLTFNNETENEE